jgi:hypothetical protein
MHAPAGRKSHALNDPFGTLDVLKGSFRASGPGQVGAG